MEFALKLDQDPDVPLYKLVSRAIRQCIEDGRLQPGDAVPSTRDMAGILGVSRITVVQGYDDLIAQGYLSAVSGSGTYVRYKSEETSVVEPQSKKWNRTLNLRALSNYGRRMSQSVPLESTAADQPELNYGAPAEQLLPYKQWRQLLLKHCRTISQSKMEHTSDPMGYLPLREAIAAYVTRSRGIKCGADMVAVFAGSQQTVNLVSRLLVETGERVAVENPGFVLAKETLVGLGAELVPVSVDGNGLVVRDLKTVRDCKLVYATPSHQDPTGAVLSVERRNELLRWAEDTGAYIIEDDYDCEYNYETRSLPSLQGMDRNENVVYLGTFWKILFPLMPVGFVVVPRHLVPVVSRAKALAERNFAMLEQYALTEFINDGHLERYIRKTRKVFAERRQKLIFALTQNFRSSINIAEQSAGMHILVHVSSAKNDSEVLEAARLAGVPLVSTKPYYLFDHHEGEFLISFANMSEDEIPPRIRQWIYSMK